MNPLLQEALLSILRKLLTFVAGYLVARGFWTEADAVTYVAAGATALLAVLWGLWRKYIDRSKLTTALALSTPTTEAHVEELVKSPTVNTPPPTVPKDTVPIIQGGSL